MGLWMLHLSFLRKSVRQLSMQSSAVQQQYMRLLQSKVVHRRSRWGPKTSIWKGLPPQAHMTTCMVWMRGALNRASYQEGIGYSFFSPEYDFLMYLEQENTFRKGIFNVKVFFLFQRVFVLLLKVFFLLLKVSFLLPKVFFLGLSCLKAKGCSGNWTRDLSHPKRESYH